MQGAEAAGVVGIGVAAAVDPRVGVALQAAQLSMQIINAGTQLNAMGKMSDADLLSLWSSRGAAMVAEHNSLFDDNLIQTPPPVIPAPAKAA
ncbi:MAG: hypothetical protein B7Z80_12600 [Rhodospirillales bacterium 20-64-7]|nr:MAG: hypothetical protein B7Z80_12600 [Rhodospirillales bacterium 20-64-7]